MKSNMIVTTDGVKEECTLLFDIDDEKTGKQYAVYTYNKVNENGESEIYLARKEGNELLPISNEEKKKIEEIVQIAQEEIYNAN